MKESSSLERRRRLSLSLIVAFSLLAIGASVFLGADWREPWLLLAPENAAILSIRLWRVGAGILVGASLAIAGAVLQAVLRNPLAEPYVLGLSSGAALGTALAIVAGGALLAPLVLPAAGFAGAVASLAIVYALACVGRRTSPHTLILAGVVWSSLCGSLLMFLVSQSNAEGLHAVMWWFLGDLQVFDARLVIGAAVFCVLAVVVLVLHLRHLDVLMLGDEVAGHVGLHPERTRRLLLGLSALLAASAVSVSGLISFVGLTVPHAARALVGPGHRRLIPASAFLGAAFLAVADGIGRAVLYPLEVPVGVITALVGAPFFLLLLRRRQKQMWT